MSIDNETNYNKRWYDDHQETIASLEKLKKLNHSARIKLSEDLVAIIKQIKEIRKEEVEPELSIGLPRVLGLYQSGHSRRWHDKSEDIDYALKTMSTLPAEDFLNIMEGLSLSI